MPLFDFDREWSWEEFAYSLPRGIPFFGKWYSRFQNVREGNYLAAANPFAGFWNMSEEDLAASIAVNMAGSYAFGRGLWWTLNFYEDYRALKFVTSVPVLAVVGTVALSHAYATTSDKMGGFASPASSGIGLSPGNPRAYDELTNMTWSDLWPF